MIVCLLVGERLAALLAPTKKRLAKIDLIHRVCYNLI